MHLNALENQLIPDADTLSLNYLPNRACWSVKSPMKSPIEGDFANQSSIVVSPIRVTNTDLPVVVEPIEAQSPIRVLSCYCFKYNLLFSINSH